MHDVPFAISKVSRQIFRDWPNTMDFTVNRLSNEPLATRITTSYIERDFKFYIYCRGKKITIHPFFV